eukprot:TRINITY_DN67424_c0_g1_i1.p1 TRINITY_DN67424_c0_g1~~TRINITY_DN67424_c0_g1_i1.p1  ORF type:complete len:321 (-),score=50.57 TRINITY_DN67424_c0_g1_i1:196-1113(-)
MEARGVDAVPIPMHLLKKGSDKIAEYYWDRVLGEWFSDYSEMGFRVFVRTIIDMIQQCTRAWEGEVNIQATLRGKTGEILHGGPAMDVIPLLRKATFQEALGFKLLKLHVDPRELQICDPKVSSDLARVNHMLEQAKERFIRSYEFDLYRRCEDAYKGNLDAIQGRDRDVNFQAIIRSHPGSVESIARHPDGHYLLVRSNVILKDDTAIASPPPLRATALHYAVLGDKAHVVNYLLSKGARSSERAECGATALDIARANNCKKAMEVLDPSQSYAHSHSPSGSPKQKRISARERIERIEEQDLIL